MWTKSIIMEAGRYVMIAGRKTKSVTIKRGDRKTPLITKPI